MDNNSAEDAIQPFVIGRKNCLYSKSVKGVKANGLEPYAYLRVLFAKLPQAQTVEEIENLLPGNITL